MLPLRDSVFQLGVEVDPIVQDDVTVLRSGTFEDLVSIYRRDLPWGSGR